MNVPTEVLCPTCMVTVKIEARRTRSGFMSRVGRCWFGHHVICLRGHVSPRMDWVDGAMPEDSAVGVCVEDGCRSEYEAWASWDEADWRRTSAGQRSTKAWVRHDS